MDSGNYREATSDSSSWDQLAPFHLSALYGRSSLWRSKFTGAAGRHLSKDTTKNQCAILRLKTVITTIILTCARWNDGCVLYKLNVQLQHITGAMCCQTSIQHMVNRYFSMIGSCVVNPVRLRLRFLLMQTVFSLEKHDHVFYWLPRAETSLFPFIFTVRTTCSSWFVL